MIIGIGCDLVDIRRISNIIAKYNSRFLERIFCVDEILASQLSYDKANFFAKRFAAKEALVKALGTGFSKAVIWRDICLLNNAMGKPYIKLTGGALDWLNKLTKGRKANIHVALSDEPPYAQAMVVIEINN